MLEILEDFQSVVEWFVPPVETPEQRVGKSREAVRLETRSLNRQIMKNEIQQEDAVKEFNRAADRGDEQGARLQASKLIRLEEQAAHLLREQEKLSRNENKMNAIVRQHSTQNALVTTMAYSNVRSPNPYQVKGVVDHYQHNKEARLALNKAINAAIEEGDELASAQPQQLQQEKLTEEQQKRMDSLMAGFNKTVTKKFIEEQSAIAGQRLSPQILDIDRAEMLKRTQANSQLLASFMAHNGC
jgi:hypothetical protein